MSEDSDVVGVILAGGMGTRLRESVQDRPKPMATVNGRPFVSYLLEMLNQAGIRKVVLCTGYMSDYFVRVLGSTYNDMTLVYSRENEPLGTAGAIKHAEPHFTGDEVLVMNGDSFVEFNVKNFLGRHRKNNAQISILLTKVNNANRYGRVEIDKFDRITGFIEKEDDNQAGLINAGVYLLSRQVINRIPTTAPCSLETNIFPTEIYNHLYGYPGDGRFIDIGTPASYAAAGEFLDSICSNTAAISLINGN